MSQITSKTDNELILKRRKKMKLKKTIMLFLLMISLFVTLCLKLQYFNIKSIEVGGNKNIQQKEISLLSGINLGNNIFYVDLKSSKNNILSNPYISNVEIKQKLPSTIQITVEEREAVFYNEKNKKYFVVDKNGILLQQRDDIKGMKLIKLDGVDYTNIELGKPLEDKDNSKNDAVKFLGELIQNNKISSITSVDLSSSIDIKVYSDNILIKLGSSDNIYEKLNKALNILVRKEFKGAKGYIDVSFDGNPIFFIEN